MQATFGLPSSTSTLRNRFDRVRALSAELVVGLSDADTGGQSMPDALADRLVTNDKRQAFIEDRGYDNANLWLSDGWSWVKEARIAAPLYLRRDENGRLDTALWTQRPCVQGPCQPRSTC